MPARLGRKYVCIWSCGRGTTRHSDSVLFSRGQIYVCTKEGYLTSNNGEEIHLSENSLKRFFKQYRAPRKKEEEIPAEVNEGILFPNDEMTRFGFISNMEDFMRQLMSDPISARVSPFLEKHGIDGPKAVEILTLKRNPDDPESAIMIKKTRIINGETDNEGHRGKDKFAIKYIMPRTNKDYTKKLRDAYISLFESNIIDGCPINEEGEGGGATSCCSVAPGDGITPPLSNVVKRKIYITEEQMEALREATTTFGATPQGNAMGDMTPPGCFGDDETLNHKSMFASGWNGGK